jgi:hypothetical protein
MIIRRGYLGLWGKLSQQRVWGASRGCIEEKGLWDLLLSYEE